MRRHIVSGIAACLALAASALVAGATAEDICARSIRELSESGVRHFYISNLPLGRAAPTLRKIVALASGVALP